MASGSGTVIVFFLAKRLVTGTEKLTSSSTV
jgi:hypothetical protein